MDAENRKDVVTGADASPTEPGSKGTELHLSDMGLCKGPSHKYATAINPHIYEPLHGSSEAITHNGYNRLKNI